MDLPLDLFWWQPGQFVREGESFCLRQRGRRKDQRELAYDYGPFADQSLTVVREAHEGKIYLERLHGSRDGGRMVIWLRRSLLAPLYCDVRFGNGRAGAVCSDASEVSFGFGASKDEARAQALCGQYRRPHSGPAGSWPRSAEPRGFLLSIGFTLGAML